MHTFSVFTSFDGAELDGLTSSPLDFRFAFVDFDAVGVPRADAAGVGFDELLSSGSSLGFGAGTGEMPASSSIWGKQPGCIEHKRSCNFKVFYIRGFYTIYPETNK